MTDIEREITIKSNEACKQHNGDAQYRYGYYDGAKWMYDKMIRKIIEYSNKNLTYVHPRTNKETCLINIHALIDAMSD